MNFSLVIPLYNEEAVFGELQQRVTQTLDRFDGECEVLWVNDGSSDKTREMIHDATLRDSRFAGVHLSRNFGHQQAVSAGLREARGEVVGVIDGDLQDPPELLFDFLAKLEEGYDVVYAIRQNRKEGFLKQLAYRVFYRVLHRLSPLRIPIDSGDFCIMRRRVVEEINRMPERHRYVRGLRHYCGFRQVGCTYERSSRAAGEPKYTFRKLVGLATDGIFTFSERPLKLATFVGFLSAGMALTYSLYTFFWRIFSDVAIPGYATITIAVLYLGSIQLICMGILGEYIGRIHNEVKGRPAVIIEEIERQH